MTIYLPRRRRVLALKAPIHPGRNKEAELDGFRVRKRLMGQDSELLGEGSQERLGEEQQHIHPSWDVGKTEWRIVTAAETEPRGLCSQA